MHIYHNTRCGKSRKALELLKNTGEEIIIHEYLKEPLTEKKLAEIIDMLGISPFELIRKNEAIYKEEYKGKDLTDKEWIAAMIEHPKLMERPIVVHGNKAVIGRPPEKVLDLK